MAEPPANLTPRQRLQLSSALNGLTTSALNDLLLYLSPPPGNIPPPSAPQSDRVYALLTWAQGTGGCGLPAILDALNEVAPNSTPLQTGTAPQRPWLVPLERNRCFTGRETPLTRLRQALTQAGRAGLSQVQAVSGLGGIGKTQTALEYAYRYYYDEAPDTAYRAVFWLRADTEQALQSGFEDIATLLQLPVAGLQEIELVVQGVKAWLAQNSGWLLVLDNADEPDFVRSYLPKQGQGHVLITSRVQDLQALGIVQPLQLETLDAAEALEFLLKRTGRENANAKETNAAQELCNELGYLPLALEQAAAYIVTHSATLSDYLASYRRRHLELLNRATPLLGEYRDPVATTWDINFQAVEAESLASADLLRASAFLHPDSIPYNLIVQSADQLGEFIQQALADDDPLAFVELLEPLRRYSLVRTDAEQSYSVHRLVQAVVRANLSTEMAQTWAERAVRAVTQAYPNADSFENWPECERLLLHAQAVVKEIYRYNFDFYEAGLLMSRLGFYVGERGQYALAELIILRALRLFKRLDLNYTDIASNLNNLANIYQFQGRYGEAESCYKDAIQMCQKGLEEKHPLVAQILSNFASLYESQGHYSEAELLHSQALKIRRQLLDPRHLDIAQSLNNLACLYQSEGRYGEAELL